MREAAVTRTVHRGVYYWPSKPQAAQWAKRHGWPTDRIISYGRGWAVQSGISGNYAGPEISPRQFCPPAKLRIF